jgi:predicted DNA-binding protein
MEQERRTKHPLSIRLRPELHERVKAFTAAQGTSTNETINVLIDRGLAGVAELHQLEAELAYLRDSLKQLQQERGEAQKRINRLTDNLLALNVQEAGRGG